MQQSDQYITASFERVQQYLDAHGDVLGVLAGSPGRVQLDSAVAQIQAQSTAQGAATRNAAAGTATKQDAMETLRVSHMQPIAKFARTQLKGAPGFAALTDSGLKHRGAALVEAARAMGTAAAPYEAQLVAAHFPADVLAELGAAADAAAQAVADRADTIRQRVEATAGIKQQVALGKQAVAMLDPVVGKLIAGNPALVAGWASAKHVFTRSATVAAPGVVTPVVAPVPSVVPAGVIAPATPPAPAARETSGTEVKAA